MIVKKEQTNSKHHPSMHVFIISWYGQHERAISIAKEVMIVEKQVSIVYSDPDPELSLDVDCNLIKRPNNLFWGDKFSACLEACNSDIMLSIHADCSSENWENLVKSCLNAHLNVPGIAVWTPLIYGTIFPLSITNIFPIKGTPLHVVAETDGMLFSLTRQSMDRMKKVDYTSNIYGWGTSPLFCAHAFATNKLVVVDKSVVVKHPLGTGYDKEQAAEQQKEFRNQFSTFELIQDRLLMAFIRMNRLQSKNIS